MKYTKIILLHHAVETLSFFSARIAEVFSASGADCLWVDIKDAAHVEKIRQFHEHGRTIALTFNFIGFSGEAELMTEDNIPVWQALSIPCINILVDHPLYYERALLFPPKNMWIGMVDRTHIRFTKRFYPHLKDCLFFMPLAGTRSDAPKEFIPFADRKYDLVFPANFVSMKHIQDKFDRLEPDYQKFYQEMIERLIQEPDTTLDEAFEDAIFQVEPEATIAQTLDAMHGMLFIDLYVRSYFRREIIRRIADAGIHILLIGKDWDEISVKHPDAITQTGMLDSAGCLKLMADSRMTLNIMPWFKEGAHDRVFNGMMQKSAVFTDLSGYLEEILTPGKDCFSFDLHNIDAVPDLIHDALANSSRLEQIAECGWHLASTNHTWENRADMLLCMMEEL